MGSIHHPTKIEEALNLNELQRLMECPKFVKRFRNKCVAIVEGKMVASGKHHSTVESSVKAHFPGLPRLIQRIR